jgi:hypothetical protein
VKNERKAFIRPPQTTKVRPSVYCWQQWSRGGNPCTLTVSESVVSWPITKIIKNGKVSVTLALVQLLFISSHFPQRREQKETLHPYLSYSGNVLFSRFILLKKKIFVTYFGWKKGIMNDACVCVVYELFHCAHVLKLCDTQIERNNKKTCPVCW